MCLPFTFNEEKPPAEMARMPHASNVRITFGTHLPTRDRLREVSGEVPRGEKMLCSGTDPESYITEYTLVYEEKPKWFI